MRYVAIEDFIDETDGSLIQAGRTYVSPEADCFRAFPERFKPVERAVLSSEGMTRIGGTTGLAGSYTPRPIRPTRPRRPTVQRAKTAVARSSYRDVELREHFVDYRVSLSSTVKREIVDEISRVHREVGEVEVAGWLFSQYPPRADLSSTSISYATRSTAGRGTRGEVYLSDPAEAEVWVHSTGLGHLKVVGDWHVHCVRGSELPSLQDARAWAGTMDTLGREAYVSVIVSPSSEMGWMCPKFSAWIAGRYGDPSQPVVGRASLA